MSNMDRVVEIGRRVASETGLLRPARLLYRTIFDHDGRKRRQSLCHFYGQIIRRGDLVFDVGANVGVYSEVFASLGANVIAIEPLPDNVRRIRNARYRNKIKIVQTAVGARVGTDKIRVATSHTMASMSPEWVCASADSPRLRGAEWGWLGEMEVSITTLDSLCQTYGLPDFIKIDVEGYEESVFDGLSIQPKCLSFEFNPEILHATQRCLEKPVFNSSSECNYIVGEPSTFVLDRWTTKELTMQHILDSRPSSWGDIFVRRPLS